MTRLPSLCALFALLAAIAGAAHAACRVEPLGTVPLQVSSGHILIAVAVNDIEAAFIMDTGAERTLMSEEAVRRLGLQRDGWVASAILGLGGGTQHPNALPRSLQLGGLALRRKTLTGDTSVTVGPLPVREVEGRPIAGLLGRDFLSPFDLDLDLPARRMTLNDVRGCGTWFLPWTVPYAAIPAATMAGNALVIQTQVEGRPMRTLLDTGASASLITAPGMFQLGLTPAMLAHDPGGNGAGVGPAPVPMRLHRFSELRIGPDVSQDPRIWVASVRVVPIVDMLLGVDWLQSRRVWLSFATRQVFVTVPQ